MTAVTARFNHVPRRLSDSLAVYLREEIYRGNLRPGQRLIELDLCKEFQVSRAPLREALLALQRDGLVEMPPHRGAKVVSFTDDDIHEIYALRLLLDPFAAGAAADRRADVTALRDAVNRAEEAFRQGDPLAAALAHADFHREVGRASGLGRVGTFISALCTQMLASHAYGSTEHPEQLATIATDHGEIVSAIARGDRPAAEAATRNHFRPVDPMLDSYRRLRESKPKLRA
jgi:DNA-binding GntR family transcriptional regulator